LNFEAILRTELHQVVAIHLTLLKAFAHLYQPLHGVGTGLAKYWHV
jgi:hypothetical protein